MNNHSTPMRAASSLTAHQNQSARCSQPATPGTPKGTASEPTGVLALLTALRISSAFVDADVLEATNEELRKFNISVRDVHNVLIDMDLTGLVGRESRLAGSEARRIALGCMLSIKIGLSKDEALAAVDHARSLNIEAIAHFIMDESKLAAGAGVQGYGCVLVGGKAAAGIGAKAAVIKSGGALVTMAKTKAALALFGWAGIGIATGLWALRIVTQAPKEAIAISRRNPDAIIFMKSADREIAKSLLNGRVYRGRKNNA